MVYLPPEDFVITLSPLKVEADKTSTWGDGHANK